MNKLKKKIPQVLAALLLGLLLFSCNGLSATAPVEYEVLYKGACNNGLIEDYEYKETYSEGTEFTTKGSFNGPVELGSTVHRGYLLSDSFSGKTPIELGYKKLTADEALTIELWPDDTFYIGSYLMCGFVYFILDLGGNFDSTLTMEIDPSGSSYTFPDETVMTDGQNNKYKITQWKDSYGNIYSPGQTVNFYELMKDKHYFAYFLYSQDQTMTSDYILKYDGNHNTGGSAPLPKGYTAGATATVAGNSGDLEKPGYAFAGWNTKPNGSGTTYQPGGSIPMNGDLTLYAQWTHNVYINFDPNYLNYTGTPPAGVIINDTSYTAPGPGTLTRNGYTFAGWNTRKDGSGYTYAEGSAILLLCNMTLYAKWEKNQIVAGNGIDLSIKNISGSTVDSAHKIYWYITTDQYCYNSNAIVKSGTMSSDTDTINVDLPSGKYFVWGLIDLDGSGGESGGDNAAIVMIYSAEYDQYAGDTCEMAMYKKDWIYDLDVTASSGYLEAKLVFNNLDNALLPEHYAPAVVHYSYTGTDFKVDSDHPLLTHVYKGTDWSSASQAFGSDLAFTATPAEYVIRMELNQNYYISCHIENSTGEPFPVVNSGDVATRFKNKEWSDQPDAITPTEEQEYVFRLEFDDSYLIGAP